MIFMLKSIFFFYFPSFARQPQVGDRYTMDDANPFEEPFCYTVQEVRSGWTKCSCGTNANEVTIKSVRDLVSFYRLIE